MAAKRKRDYAAERRRRNEAARRLGFSSLDALAKARKRGQYPSAKAIRTIPTEAVRAQRISEARNANLAGTRNAKELAEWDRLSQRWSNSRARQDGTRFDAKWSADRRAAYYRAFVRDWRIPNDERDFAPTYEYMRTYPDGFAYQPLDANPYASQ